MSANSLLSILHISDFHFTRRRIRDQEIVVDALTKDLAGLCIGHRRPDIVMFTGDLVNAGGTDRHEEAYDFLLSRVSAATGCSDERIFIVPGNHDVAQAVVDSSRDVHLEWRSQSNDMAAINSLFEKNAFQDIAARKFAAYHELERYLSETMLKHRNVFATVYHIDHLNVDIVVLNTSMLSTGGHKDLGADEGKLALPEYAVLDALKALTQDSYRIFTTHHPFEMLSESAARYLRGAIQEHAHLHVFGHRHDPLTVKMSSYKGELFSDQAGAVFTQRKNAYIGYSLIVVDRTTNYYETHLRTYFDDRKLFDEARDIVEQGRFYSSQESREFWRGIATPVDDAKLREHLAGKCLSALKAEQTTALGNRDVHEMFVSPPMSRTAVQHVSGDETKNMVETAVAFENLVSEEGSVIIYAAPEYGRTTVLRELQYRLLSEAAILKVPRLPILVDFSDIKHNFSSLLRVVKSRAVVPLDDVDVESLLKLGHVCILLDDVVFGDAKRVSILREFVSRYPKVRYILSSPKMSAAPYGAQVVPEMPIHFDFVELRVLRRRDMRQLVAKFNSGGDVDVVLDRLQSEFREINLPFTAANGSILMAIYEEHSGFRPINRSVLIEQFIDTTLRKAEIEQSQRVTFDYANKTALLAHLAAWMAGENNYIPNVDAVREKIRSYLDSVGLNASIDALMTEFLTARIFVSRSEDRLSFRYRAVLEYFVAMQMLNDQTFKAWVMEDVRYLQFTNEIQYYSGKLRNDASLVDEIGNRFTALLQQLEASDGAIDLGQLATLELPAKNTSLSVDHLAKQLSATPLSEEQRDEELQTELPRDVEGRQEVFRPQIDDPGQRLLVSLFLYSGVIKNMELIADAEKRRHLAAVWKGWAAFLHMSLSVVAELARHRRIRINGVLYELNAPIAMSDAELARLIALGMPTGVSRLVAATLGTEKLERQLVEPQLDSPQQPLVYEFFRAALIADLRLASTPGALQAAMDALRSSAYLSESLIWKIADLRRLDRLQQKHFEQIVTRLAGAIAELKGGQKSAQDDERNRQIQRLEKEGLVLRLRRQSEGD